MHKCIDKRKEMCCFNNELFRFGWDLVIKNDSNIQKNNYSYLG